MFLIQQYLALALTLFIFVITPGPGIFATVSRSLSHGTVAGLVITFGLVCGDLVYLVFTMWGLVALASRYPIAFVIFQIMGAIWLIVLAVQLWRDRPNPVVNDSTVKSKKMLDHYFAGLAISLTNPKVILFYLGILPGFFNLTIMTLPQKIIILFLATIVLFIGCGSYAVLTGRARHLFNSPKALIGLNRGAALLLLLTATWIILRGIISLI